MTGRLILVTPGEMFGYLRVLEVLEPRRDARGASRRWVRCQCRCGAVTDHRLASLRCGGALSCGCLRLERVTSHGKTHSPEHRTWRDMLQRCLNPKNPRYRDYGGRGIKVCDRWLSFENFYEDMGERPVGDLSIDRRDNDGNYESDNCRWATRTEQQNNRRDSTHAYS